MALQCFSDVLCSGSADKCSLAHSPEALKGVMHKLRYEFAAGCHMADSLAKEQLV